MEYIDFQGEKWSIENGDWISYQYLDEEKEKSNFKKNFSKAYFVILFFLIAIFLFIIK